MRGAWVCAPIAVAVLGLCQLSVSTLCSHHLISKTKQLRRMQVSPTRRLALYDGSTSDISQQLYIRYLEGATIDPLNLTSVPADVESRLDGLNVTFIDLPGIIQRGLLWDTGYAIDMDSNPVEIRTLDNRSMSDIMVPFDVFSNAGCISMNCVQDDGFTAKSNMYCTGDQMLSAARCVAMPSLSLGSDVHMAMWSTGGSSSDIPEINLLEHAWMSDNVSYKVLSVHTANQAEEPAFGSCADYGSVVIPCFPPNNLTDDLVARMIKPVASEWVDNWVNEWLTNPVSGQNDAALTSKSSNKLFWIPVILGCIIIVGFGALAYRRQKIRAEIESGVARLWDDSQILAVRIPREKVSIDHLLSRGGFGEVYSGTYNGEPVAIKKLLNCARKDMREVEAFLSEAKLMAELDHPNIVKLVGVAWDSLAEVCIVLEFMQNGDLRTLLNEFQQNGRDRGFDNEKLNIAHDVAHALVYLHSFEPPVLHRDLKSKNILLTQNFDAKVTDFGVSRRQSDQILTAGVGTSLWMAPEVMMGGKYDTKADIFSFGVVLYELDSHDAPYANTKRDGNQLTDTAILQLVATGMLRVEFSDYCTPELAQLGAACVELDPNLRPSAAEVMYKLQQIGKGYAHRTL